MTAIEFRDKKFGEIQELLEKLSSLEGASFSPESKDRLFRTYQRQIERLTAIVNSPAFERLCAGGLNTNANNADTIESHFTQP
jgi:hypothetical protein